MMKASAVIGSVRLWLVAACGVVVLAAACGENTDEGVAKVESEIIGGSAPLSVTTRRALGLVEFGCSGALFTKDWVLTAGHCVPWGNVPAMTFRMPRPNGGFDERSATYAVQVAATDLAMLKLGPAFLGNLWPNVNHPVTTASASSFVDTDITCYGEGANAYDSDGAGIVGFGTYKSITKRVLSMSVDSLGTEVYILTSPDGQNALTFGDSGSNCFTSTGEVVSVLSSGSCSRWAGMGEENDPGCTGETVIAERDSFLPATSKWRSYMTQALTRLGTTFEPLPLINGWQPSAFGANGPGVTNVSNVVTLRGAIRGGTAQMPFRLPAAYRPSARVHVPVSTTGTTIGRLIIDSNGDVNIECEGGPGLCGDSVDFTSLDGVSYIRSPGAATPLALLNGWATAPFGNRAPAVQIVNGQAHFIGGMLTSGSDAQAFELPPGFRPAVHTWVPVSLCWSAKGRMSIATNGNVIIQPEDNDWSSAKCFTSLDGASFAINATSGTTVSLQNGWVGSSFGAGPVRVWNDGGVVRFKGAVSSGTSGSIMTLPAQFRPATNVWLYVDAFGGGRSRVEVSPSGAVFVDPPALLPDAQSFLSFDGAEFGI